MSEIIRTKNPPKPVILGGPMEIFNHYSALAFVELASRELSLEDFEVMLRAAKDVANHRLCARELVKSFTLQKEAKYNG